MTLRLMHFLLSKECVDWMRTLTGQLLIYYINGGLVLIHNKQPKVLTLIIIGRGWEIQSP